MLRRDRLTKNIGIVCRKRRGFDNIAKTCSFKKFLKEAVVEQSPDFSGAHTVVFEFAAHTFISDRPNPEPGGYVIDVSLDGIPDLVLQPVGASLLLSWSPVTLDFDDNPTQISHYELYADDVPFSRADIRDMTPLVPVVPGESIAIVPAGPNRYYSVLAVDVRGNRSPF